VTLYKKYDLGR